jgi:hypothetical protein
MHWMLLRQSAMGTPNSSKAAALRPMIHFDRKRAPRSLSPEN